MASVRATAFCIGRSGPLSLIRDFFGHEVPPVLPLSLLTQVRRLKHDLIHLNFIKIGVEGFDASDIAEISSALQRLREIYDQVPLAVGRVDYWFVTTDEADDYTTIDDDDEAAELTHEWTADGAAFDVFLVKSYTGTTAGLSPTHGPCDKDSKEMNGSVVELQGTSVSTSQVIGHEVGHYLGLSAEHSSDPANLMFDTVPNGGQLTGGQGQTMLEHCFVWPGC